MNVEIKREAIEECGSHDDGASDQIASGQQVGTRDSG